MPLVLLCGRPCVGKTTVAETLVARLRAAGRTVVLVNEEGLRIRKSDGYATAAAEKMVRGALFSAVERSVNSEVVVVLDSVNYIKGFRYQLFCLAKNQATTHCVLEVDAPLEVARERNASRTTDRLADEVFLDLWRRYEAPDEKNRWDSPLFRVDFAGEVRPVDELAGLLNRADLAEARGEPSAVVVGGCGGGGGGGGGGGADGSGASSASSVPTATPVAVRSGFKRAPKPSAPAPTPPTLPAPSIDVDFLPEDAMRAGSESGVESEGEDGSDAWSGGGPGSEAEERRSRAGSLGEGRGALLDAEEARRTESTAVSETAVLDAVVKCVLEGRRHRPNHSTLVSRAASSDFLHETDRLTSEIVSALGSALATAIVGDSVQVPLAGGATVQVLRRATVSELRRLRRQFLRLLALRPAASPEVAAALFVEFVNVALRAPAAG